jgi:hypothetical protein
VRQSVAVVPPDFDSGRLPQGAHGEQVGFQPSLTFVEFIS